ncbi:hypothetical protein [Williamsia sp. M5A3_1d]
MWNTMSGISGADAHAERRGGRTGGGWESLTILPDAGGVHTSGQAP